jgi:ComEC/Rec2-related protein
LFLIWLVIFYATGIGIYFSLNFEPKLTILLLLTFILVILSKKARPFMLLLAIACGFTMTQVKTILLNTPTLSKQIKVAYISGVVGEISPAKSAKKLIIEQPQIAKYPQVKLKKIRLLARTSLNNAKVGDEISIMAHLSAPMSPKIPGGYDFALRAYFEGIGAVGYAVSEAKIIKKHQNNFFMDKLSRFRWRLFSDIIDAIGPKEGNIAASLMIGEYNGINQAILDEMRIAGISHILSVSGMHLSVMAMICFFVARIVINLLHKYTAKWHAKKIAAIFALLGSFFYLLISGLQVAALRSFIMVAFTIIAVMLDSINSTLRAVFLAGFIILFFAPQNLLNPSFQMSFAAVIALIACYCDYALKMKEQGGSIFAKVKFYFYASVLSSFIASIATAPYILYHFNQFSHYSVIANLLAMPLTSFIIMPGVILAFLLYPFNLMHLALVPMQQAIKVLILIAHYVAKMPYSSFISKSMPCVSLILLTIGLLWYCLFRGKFKFPSVIFLTLGALLMIFNQKPVLLFDGKSKVFAYLNDNQEVIFSAKKISRFTKDNWLRYLGKSKASYYNSNINQELKVENERCLLLLDKQRYDFSCQHKKNLHFGNKLQFKSQEVNLPTGNKVDFIYLHQDHILVKSNQEGLRLWQINHIP